MFKVRIKFEKNEYSAYISHLDLMNTLQRSLVRAKLPVRYTEGFNPPIYPFWCLCPPATKANASWPILI